jgi:hypothetical protein
MTDLRECRAAGDRRYDNQYSCREAPKPLDAHRRPCLRYRLRTETYLAAGSAETRARVDSHTAEPIVSADSSLEEDGFEPSVPPSKRRPWRGGPRPTTVVSRDDLSLMTPSTYQSGISARQQPRDPFVRAVPMVRIHFPPAESLRTFGSSWDCKANGPRSR